MNGRAPDMADTHFEHPRLAAIYDALDHDRSDLDVYVRLVHELGPRRVLDVGCGTGTFALMLADRGLDVVDVATMTANVAQAIVHPRMWEGTLRGVREALRPDGHLVFETRVPEYRAWEDWNPTATRRSTDIPGVGTVDTWVELTNTDGPLVSFRSTFVFASDGEVLTSDSTLRFRERDEVEASLVAHGYALDEVRDAPDRPGREIVFIARRTF